MAEALHSKRVRREELHSPASSARSTPDPELEELLRARLRNHFIFTTAETDDAALQDAVVSDEEETELRLFTTTSSSAPTTHKIRLSSPDAANGEPGFLVKKPRSYYFADEPTSEDQLRLQAAAVDGKTISELSKLPWPGCALPWKVKKLSPAGFKREVLVGHPPQPATVEETIHKRARKGKKTRIALRKKMQANKDKHEEQARLAKEKEEAEREKRTRRNREKKLKKKAKSQAKKLEGAEGTENTNEQAEARQDESMDEN
ncbi:hypothetical protein HBH56_174630 [Parastagonospora nodorum]|uniref:Uncharacterized protein n=2 Tax=Phaeosphaeria nodorum (strain SN15 / ATCC MYA-4574 / FGSC 10173) TaxID=321614 RepID=A0A7U2F0N9_PHANO|nr:hypothetical protein SNOG_01266 [Parastagonospora nodorum SN15]KAH3908406.1 hypothetical protein HBH56_174630 [Parastagonospora nodorum]EAT90915.1 hypothetical protein SNOG_01266 [Parastagonospora nodorum SN15]KAH3926366.1 hypothetical protein HBH54_168520 [Parastagonospora nodorum]KAH3955849.1 hypothetical protein HBH53_001330 [Parastagonospora nodorum]KAH3965700.1 hypothetical protein HBH52_205180 [Parastagonospora nodorum]